MLLTIAAAVIVGVVVARLAWAVDDYFNRKAHR